VEYKINVNIAEGFDEHVDVAKTLMLDTNLFSALKNLALGNGPYVPQTWIHMIGEVADEEICTYRDWLRPTTREILLRYLKKYPVLLYDFSVYQEFWNASDVLFHGEHTEGEMIGKYAMLIIGARVDSTNDHCYYLVQNSWKNTKSIEISDKYLRSCCASALS
jgi:hypothetical protein